MAEKKAFGLVGPISSGIWLVSDYLKEQGFHYYRLSDDLRADSLAKKERKDVTEREHWGWVGDTLRAEYGVDILARRTLDRVLRDDYPKVIIDSIRHPDELTYIKRGLSGVVMVGMDAPVEVRHRLSILRGRGVDPVNLEEFKKIDAGELNGNGHSATQNIKASLGLVDIMFKHQAHTSDELDRLKLKVIDELTPLLT